MSKTEIRKKQRNGTGGGNPFLIVYHIIQGALIGLGAVLPASPAVCLPWCSAFTSL